MTLTEFKTRCRCCRGPVSFDLKSYNSQRIFHILCNLHILFQVFPHSFTFVFLFAILFCPVFIRPNPTYSPSHEQRASVMLSRFRTENTPLVAFSSTYCTCTVKHDFPFFHCSQSISFCVFLSHFFLVSAVCVCVPTPRPLHLIRKRTHRRKMIQMQKIKRSSIWMHFAHKSNDYECNMCKAN